MAALVYTGKEGSITVDATAVEVTSFAITETGGTLDITDGSDAAGGYRAKAPGKFKEWSGTVEVLLKAGVDEFAVNAAAAFVGIGTNSTGTLTYTGEVVVTEIVDTIPVEAEEVVKQTINIEGTGALVKVNAVI